MAKLKKISLPILALLLASYISYVQFRQTNNEDFLRQLTILGSRFGHALYYHQKAIQHFDELKKSKNDKKDYLQIELYLNKSLHICHSIEEEIDSIEIDLPFGYRRLLENIQLQKKASNSYLKILPKLSQQPKFPHELKIEFNLSKQALDKTIRAIHKSFPPGNTNGDRQSTLMAKYIFLLLEKKDNYEVRHKIYIHLSNLFESSIKEGTILTDGKYLDGNMQLHYVMRKPYDSLFDLIFYDFIQKVSLYGIQAPDKTEVKLVSYMIKKYNKNLVSRKRIKLMSLHKVELQKEPAVLAIGPDGITLQEHLLKAGLAKIDPKLKSIPKRWQEVADRARNTRKGIFQ